MNSSQVLQEKRYGSFLQTSFIGLNATKEGQDAGYLYTHERFNWYSMGHMI